MSKSSELDRAAKTYILQCISETTEGESMTIQESLDYINKRFESEYGWRVKQVGPQRAMIDWLQGLAINIAFYNCDIIKLAVEWESLPLNHTEKQADKITDNYFNFIACKLLQLINGYRVPGSIEQ